MTPTLEKWAVFLSHANKDGPLVASFVEEVLERALDLPSRAIFYSSRKPSPIPAGADQNPVIRDALLQSKVVVALVSPNFYASPYCMAELGAAWMAGKLIPVLVPPLSFGDLKGVLGGVQALQINSFEALESLGDDLLQRLQIQHPPATQRRTRVQTFLEALDSKLGALRMIQPQSSPAATLSERELSDELERRRNALFEIPQEEKLRARELDGLENAGLAKLPAPRQGVFPELERGSYFSFNSRSHEYEWGADLKYDGASLSTGFAGLDFGYFLNIGSPSLSDLAALTESLPGWLAPEKASAWEYLWTYRPPSVTAEARRAQREAGNGVAIKGARISETAPILEGASYLFRSIRYRDSDLLVVLRVQRKLADRSIVIAWRILKAFDTPHAQGAEPQS